jgi:hypothetical protein
MTTLDWGALQKQAEDAGIASLPDDTYTMRCESGNWGVTKGQGKPRFSFKMVVTAGPLLGKAYFLTLFIPDGKGENAGFKAAMFLEALTALGVPAGTPPEAAAQIPVGQVFTVNLKTTNKNNRNFQNAKVLGKVETPVVPQVPAPQSAAPSTLFSGSPAI